MAKQLTNQQENAYMMKVEELRTLNGRLTDPILQSMVKNRFPLTKQTYLELDFMLDGIPEQLPDEYEMPVGLE